MNSNNISYLGRFGVSKDITINFEHPLILDYTACLILYRLGLLETVCSWFPKVWIDQHLFEIWLSDINQLKSVQISVVQQAVRMSDKIKDLQFLSYSSKENISRAGVDHILLLCAEDMNAILVAGPHSDNPGSDGWEKLQIHPYALYAALDRMKLPHPKYDYTVSLEEPIAKIKPQCRLVLDRLVIDELQLADALETVFNLFHVVLPNELVSEIHNEADRYRNRVGIVNLLEEAYNVASKRWENHPKTKSNAKRSGQKCLSSAIY